MTRDELAQSVSLDAEILSKLVALIPDAGPDECWIWQGASNPMGYARLSHKGSSLTVSHLILRAAVGPAPEGKPVALHACDNPPCVNPSHLRWGSQSDNARDAVERGRHTATRKTHCARGHPLSGDNLYFHAARNQRRCRECMREDNRKMYHRTKAKNNREVTAIGIQSIEGERAK